MSVCKELTSEGRCAQVTMQPWPARDEERFAVGKAQLIGMEMNPFEFSADDLCHLTLEIFIEVSWSCVFSFLTCRVFFFSLFFLFFCGRSGCVHDVCLASVRRAEGVLRAVFCWGRVYCDRARSGEGVVGTRGALVGGEVQSHAWERLA